MSKKCPNCNEYIPDEASFCMNCFTKISPVLPENTVVNNKNKKIFIPVLITSALMLIIALSCIIAVFGKNINNHNNQTSNSVSTSERITTTAATSTTTEITATETTTQTTITTTTTTEASTATSETTTDKSTTKKETTQPSGTMKYSSYGNGIIITSYSGNESNIIIPDIIDGKTVNAVSENAFSNNKYIKSITFEEGSSPKALNIKPNAFNNLNSLTTLNLPSRITAENFTTCITNCNNLKSVNISNKYSNSDYYSSNGIVYSSDNALVLYPAGKTSYSYTVPYKVTAINNNSFKGNTYLKKIKFSKREELNVSWSNLFSKNNIKNLESIEVYAGTDADITGIQYFNGEINYYD